jgi:hypothetical protein
MFDFYDFFGPHGMEGGRRVRVIAAIIGAIVGAAIGWLAALIGEASTLATFGYAIVGAVAGGAFCAIFAILTLVAAVILLVVVGIVVWEYFKVAG